MPLRILCFNIHGGYDMKRKRDLRRVHQLMDVHDIDIGVFQEMETRVSRGGALSDIETLSGPDRPHYLPGLAMKEGEGWYGNLIVSRYPILRGIVHDLEYKFSYEPRNAVDTLIETPMGKMRIIGTHLSLTPWERWDEAKALIRLMNAVDEEEKNPLLLMGDFNEWKPQSRLIRHMNGLMKAQPCGPSFPSSWPILQLDRVWHDHLPHPIKAEVLMEKDTRWLSDHLPLKITVGKSA